MNHYEHNLQVACVRWFRMQYPKYAKLLFAIPNGGKRHLTTAKKMKAEGQMKGVPDLMLAAPKYGMLASQCGQYTIESHGLFIEMKSATGRLSAEQSAYLVALELQGYKTAVCKSFDEFKQTIEDYLK